MKKKCLIIDDDATARLIINKLCTDSQNFEVAQEFTNAIDAIKYLNIENDIDVIFLDIHMPSFTGIDFIKTINNSPLIVLTTSDENFALEAFEYENVIDYLVKPIKVERFKKTIEKIAKTFLQKSDNRHSNKNDSIKNLYVNIDRRLVKINIPDIYLIEAKGDYIRIKTEKGNHIVHSTLKKIEEKLPNDLFLKIHRSYLINTHKIVDIEDNSVLINQEIVPISRANRGELMKRLNLL